MGGFDDYRRCPNCLVAGAAYHKQDGDPDKCDKCGHEGPAMDFRFKYTEEAHEMQSGFLRVLQDSIGTHAMELAVKKKTMVITKEIMYEATRVAVSFLGIEPERGGLGGFFDASKQGGS